MNKNQSDDYTVKRLLEAIQLAARLGGHNIRLKIIQQELPESNGQSIASSVNLSGNMVGRDGVQSA